MVSQEKNSSCLWQLCLLFIKNLECPTEEAHLEKKERSFVVYVRRKLCALKVVYKDTALWDLADLSTSFLSLWQDQMLEMSFTEIHIHVLYAMYTPHEFTVI